MNYFTHKDLRSGRGNSIIDKILFNLGNMIDCNKYSLTSYEDMIISVRLHKNHDLTQDCEIQPYDSIGVLVEYIIEGQ